MYTYIRGCERAIEGPGSVCVGGGDPEMWKYFIAIEDPGGMWKDCISI